MTTKAATEFDQVFEELEAPDYPATRDRCGTEGTNASMDEHVCGELIASRAGECDKWCVFKHYRKRILNAAGLLVAEAETEQQAAQIVTEHNQHATLIEQRDPLLATLRKLAAFDDAGGNTVLRKQGDYSGFDELGAVKTARELLATIEQEMEVKSNTSRKVGR